MIRLTGPSDVSGGTAYAAQARMQSGDYNDKKTGTESGCFSGRFPLASGDGDLHHPDKRSSSGYFRAGDSPKHILSDCIHGHSPHKLHVVEKRLPPRLFLCRLHAALFLPEQHFPPALHPFLTVPLTGYKFRPVYRSIYSNHKPQGHFLSAPASPEAQRASADPAYRPHRQT